MRHTAPLLPRVTVQQSSLQIRQQLHSLSLHMLLHVVFAATVALHQMLPRTAATMTNVSMTDVSVTAAMMVQLLNCG